MKVEVVWKLGESTKTSIKISITYKKTEDSVFNTLKKILNVSIQNISLIWKCLYHTECGVWCDIGLVKIQVISSARCLIKCKKRLLHSLKVRT